MTVIRDNERMKRRLLLVGVSTVVIVTPGFATGAWAQNVGPGATEAQVAAEATEATKAEDIVVTGTRVVRDGYLAPTPTSVIGAQEIAARAPANLADFINTLPSLQASTTPRTTVAGTSDGAGGVNALNLRNLGARRTLVLLDGQRVAASTLDGLIDINQFPQALVSRVDVVTGGASADWGSDAVAGVVNFVLDRKLSGFRAEAQGGITTYGDNESYRLSVAAGTGFLDGRGHLLFSAEIAGNDGVSGVPRDWYNGAKLFFNPGYTATNGQPQLLVRPGTGFSTVAPGGIITSGPLRGTYFGPGGTPTQLNFGPVVSDPFMQGGDWAYTDFAKTGDLDPRLSRQNLFFRGSFDISDRLQLFAQISYGRAKSYVNNGAQYKFGNVVARSDNAFIPASIAARMSALGLTSITLGTWNEDLGGKIVQSERTSWRPMIGAIGSFDAFGSKWSWDAYAQRGENKSYVSADLSINANYDAAVDSVRNANGAIVCRSTLTNPNNGCVPYNVFGTGVNSSAAIDYITGTSWGVTNLRQDVMAANLRGDPFSTWAGPVSVAMGAEYRREKVSGRNDPLSNIRAYFAGNFRSSFGSYNVKEAYAQAVVPLAKDVPFARKLDVNAGVRFTNYSTSGSVATWKVGLTYSPIDDIIIRATRSRDIRAPNLAELFQASQTATVTLADPFRGNATATGVQVTQGNLALQPEKAQTTGLGIVLKPRFVPGLSASLDYYNINIASAISTVNAQTLVAQCFAGNALLCSQISRNSVGIISQVVVQPINLARQISRGLDFEATYRRHLDLPTGQGNLTLRFLGTRYLKNYVNNGINAPTDTVGTNSSNGSARISLPKWSFNASAVWDQGPFGAMLAVRGISSGVYNTSYIECTSGCPTSTADYMTIENNRIRGAAYVDTSISYRLSEQTQFFVSVDNVANKSPVQVAYGTSVGGAPISINPALYDILGRTFRVGIRFRN